MTQPEPETSPHKGEGETAQLKACLEVGKLLTSTLRLPAILELIMLQVSHLVGAQNWSLLLRDEKTGDLTFEVIVGVDSELLKGVSLSPGVGIAGHVAETGDTLVLPDVRADPRFFQQIDGMTGFTSRSIVCLPLSCRGRILGVIEVINVESMEQFAEKDLPILRILADYAAIAIQNARDVQEIHHLSITDEYTGLYNARHLHQIVDDLVARAATEKELVFSIAFADIDDFKQIVDTYGHLLGTQVLKELGQTMATCLSERDILAKYGGDEYVIVMPGQGKSAARTLVERIVRSIAASTYLAAEEQPVHVTASFGISTCPEDGLTKKDLLLLADQALYSIKNSSKNAVALA